MAAATGGVIVGGNRIDLSPMLWLFPTADDCRCLPPMPLFLTLPSSASRKEKTF